MAAPGDVEGLDEGVDELGGADVAAGQPLPEGDHAGVAVDEGAVEVEEGPDPRSLRPGRDLGEQVVDPVVVAHAEAPWRERAIWRTTATARTAAPSSAANSSRAVRSSSPPGPSRPRLPASLIAPRHQVLGDRLGAVQVVLEPALPGHPQALQHQRLLVDRGGGLAGRQPVGHHLVGLQERPDDAVRDQQVGLADRGRQLGGGEVAVAPQRAGQGDLGAQLLVVLALGGEEELVLQQVAQGEGVLPGGRGDVGAVDLGGLHGGDLRDRAGDEVVGHGVAVEAGLVGAARADRVDGLEAAVVLLDHALADQGAQRPAQALGPAEVDVGGQRQPALAHVGQQRLEDGQRLRERHRPAVVVEQPEGHQRRRRDRGGGVDPVRDLEGHPRDHLGGLARAGPGRRPPRAPRAARAWGRSARARGRGGATGRGRSAPPRSGSRGSWCRRPPRATARRPRAAGRRRSRPAPAARRRRRPRWPGTRRPAT